MQATEAAEWVDPDRWRATSPVERLWLLRLVQANIDRYFDELVSADCHAKGIDPERPDHPLIEWSRRVRHGWPGRAVSGPAVLMVH